MIPRGLTKCEVCGEYRGTTTEAWRGEEGPEPYTVLCLCDGLTCRRCGVGKVRPPGQDYYDWRDDRWWHTPYFGAMVPCADCSRREREGGGGGGDRAA